MRIRLLWVLFSFVIYSLTFTGCQSGGGKSPHSSNIGDAVSPTETLPPEAEAILLESLSNIEEETTKALYLSYDDSASTASVEIVKYRINNEMPFYYYEDLGRPWEFLNYEEFDHDNQEDLGLFDVSLALNKINIGKEYSDICDTCNHIYELGVHVSSPYIENAERGNAVITLLIDISASMNEPIMFDALSESEYGGGSLIDTVKQGAKVMWDELKEGDVVNLITFDTKASILKEGFVVSDNKDEYIELIDSIIARGSTNLNEGVETAYDVAARTYDPEKINRVIILTDAHANTGEVDATIISNNVSINNEEGIYFSGLGLGTGFNEAFLNELTDAGKGAYFSITSTSDVEKAFGSRFNSLINVAARDVMFKLNFPSDLIHLHSSAEEASENIQDVQSTNFSYNTSQFFYELFIAKSDEIESEEITITISWKDPISLEQNETVITKTIGEIVGLDQENIVQARVVSVLPSLINGSARCDEFEQINENIELTNNIIDEYIGLIQNYCAQEK